MEEKNICRPKEEGVISCKVNLPNGKIIHKEYKAPERYIKIVEKDFVENILKPKRLELLENRNLIRRTQRFLQTKEPECWNEFTFEDNDSVRILLEPRGKCIQKDERWKKGVREIKSIAENIGSNLITK